MARDVCGGCGRLTSVCICGALVEVQSPLRVVILQHPSELKQPLATVPLLQRCLTPCEVHVGEDFNGTEIQARLQAQATGVALLFPSSEEAAPADGLCFTPHTLLVIDGTWRKARRILHTNPWLLELPRMSLSDACPSRYRIRQSSVPGSLCTLEAVAFGLFELSGESRMLELLRPFEAMVDMQIKKMGAEVFRAHYQKET